jgi:phage tail tape-measure protein
MRATAKAVDSAGGGYGYLDEVKTDRLETQAVRNIHDTEILYVTWEAHAKEGSLVWTSATGTLVGGVAGGLIGSACTANPAGSIVGAGVGGGVGGAVGSWAGSGYGASFRIEIAIYCTKDGDPSANIKRVFTKTEGDDELYWKSSWGRNARWDGITHE